MGEHHPGPGQTMALPQGNLGLLHSDLATRLLTSTIPARFAYIARDGTPRVMPTWFHWTGEELVMPTFVSAPHVRHPAAPARRAARQPGGGYHHRHRRLPTTGASAPRSRVVDRGGRVVPEYALAAHRYLGEEAASAYLAQIDQPGTRMARIAVRPRWVGIVDFQTRMPSGLGGISG